ncbi:ras GEF [Ramaria rubella]|nr:ras GEF [Ramaria rubella]
MPRTDGGSVIPQWHCKTQTKSATIDVIPAHQNGGTLPPRPSTGDSSRFPPTLPQIDETLTGFDLEDSLKECIIQVSIPEPVAVVPTTLVDPSTSESVISHHYTHPDTESLLSGDSMKPCTSSLVVGETGHDGIYVKYGPDGLVTSATLRGLVDRLILGTGDYGADRDFRETFLTSYRAFTNADQLFDLLVKQFEAASSPMHTAKQRASVRYSVIIILELWLRENYVEAKDVSRLQRMRDFAVSVQASSRVSDFFHDAAHKLIQLLDKHLNVFLSPPVPPLTPSSSFSSLRNPQMSSEITPQILASTLTSIECDRYKKLMTADYIDWLEGIQGSSSISSYLIDNKKLSHWVEKSILRPPSQSERAENLKYFLIVYKECRKLRNFSSACALANGLTTTSITALKRTFGELDKKVLPIFRDAQKLVSYDRNFKAYRAALTESDGACIPWLYVHLHDLKIVHRSHQIFVNEDGWTDLINFERCRRVHLRIRQILKYEVLSPDPVSALDREHYARVLTLVDAELKAFVTDNKLYVWLQKRGSQLAVEEQENYDTHEEELKKAGFLLPGATSAALHARKPSMDQSSRHTSKSTIQPPTTPGSVTTAVSPLLPSRRVVYSVFSLDVFDRNSERCLDGRITRESEHPAASGGFSDVWRGTMDGRTVAIKTLRPFNSGRRIEESKLLKNSGHISPQRLWREYAAWTWVTHPIVLECLGFSYDFSPQPYILPSLISPWMANGTLDNYIDKNPKVDRFQMLVDVAEGLSFLHDQHPSIIHGDLRAGNILISDTGRPCLSDFGLSRVLKLEGMTTSSELAGSLRWMSPELLRDDVVPSTSSDVWAYAMTILEVMSGKLPYDEVKNTAAVLSLIHQGQVPLRPAERVVLTDEIWAICQKCWNIVPRQRPAMHAVFMEIQEIDR